ncbi:MAG: flagellar export protein FliJ [Pseudomonadales bacterium]|nr:flagellar export protein FliJ [Pseudomonadales bacterium]
MKNRFESLLKIAEVKENNAAKEYVEARDAWEFNQARLNELRAFRDEYRDPAASVSVSPRQFESARVFLSRLSTAIDNQEEEVSRLMAQVELGQQSWQATRVKRKSIELLSEKRLADALGEARKKEQSDLDEAGQRSRPGF